MPEPETAPKPGIRLSLKLKLSLLITGLLVAAVVLLSGFLLYQAERSLVAEMTKRGLTIAQNLANAAKNSLLTNDQLTLNLLVKDTMKDEDVAYVVVADHDGKVLAHTDVSLIGRKLERPADLKPLGEVPLVQTYAVRRRPPHRLCRAADLPPGVGGIRLRGLQPEVHRSRAVQGS